MLSLPPDLAATLRFPTALPGRPDHWVARAGAAGHPVLVKRWQPAEGPALDQRMAWQAAATRALGDGCPAVLARQRHGGAVWTVSRYEPGGPPPLPLGPGLARRALVLLDRLHRAGLVHRDIKADNLHRTADGRLLLLDLEEVWPCAGPRPGSALGSAAAQDPSTAAATPAADRFALGALLPPGPLRRALRAPAALRPAGLAELWPLLAPRPGPLPPLAPTGWAALHAVPARAQALLASPGGAAALDRLRRQGMGRPRAGQLWISTDELDHWWAAAGAPGLGAAAEAIAAGHFGAVLAGACARSDHATIAAAAAAATAPPLLRQARRHLPPDHPAAPLLHARVRSATDPAAAAAMVPAPLRPALLLAGDPAAALAACPPGPGQVRAAALLALGRPDAALAALPTPATPLDRARADQLAAAAHLAAGRPAAAHAAATAALGALVPGAAPRLRATAAAHQRIALAALPGGAAVPPDPALLHNLLDHVDATTGRAVLAAEHQLALRADEPELAAELAAQLTAPPTAPEAP